MSFREFTRSLLSCLLAALLLPAVPAAAQDHVVSRSELHHALSTAAQQRQANAARLERFFSSEPARKALATARLDPARVTQAIPYLSDQELAQLAQRAEAVESNFAGAGISLTNQQVTYLIIGLIAIAVIAIVASR